MTSRALALFATSALIAAACGGGAAPASQTPTPAAATTAAGSPSPAAASPTRAPTSIAIVSPTAGTAITGPFTVIVRVRSFKQDGTKIGTAKADGVGHWHLSIDGKYAGLSVSDSISFPNDAFPEVSAGEHELTADLHNNDHSPVDGVNAAKVKVNVTTALKYAAASGAPGIKIVGPAAGASRGGPTDITVMIAGFKQDGTKIGTPVTAGVGHWHLMVDGKYAGLSVSSVISIPNDAVPEISAGDHELTADLHNNDHSPVAGAPASTIKVSFSQAVKYSP